MSITLSALRTQIRQRCDKEDSEFVTDSEVTSYINSSIAELHDILVQSYGGDYFVEQITFTTVANKTDYLLSDIVVGSGTLQDVFFKLHGIDAKLNAAATADEDEDADATANGDPYFALQKFNFNERNRFQTGSPWTVMGLANIRYRIVGSKIILTPAPDANTTIRAWYVPKAPLLADDADELDDINYWSEYVIADVCIKILQKEESDTTVFERQKVALKRRIEEAAQARDASQPDSISDIYSENDPYWFTRVRS